MGSETSKTITTENGTMTHQISSNCYWFNPSCNSKAETYSYIGSSSSKPGSAPTYTSMFGSTSPGIILVGLSILSAALMLVLIAMAVRRRPSAAVPAEKLNSSGPDVESGVAEAEVNDSNSFSDDEITEFQIRKSSRPGISDYDSDGIILSPRSKVRSYKYKLRRLFSIKAHLPTTPERYISISELKFDDDFNNVEQGKPKPIHGIQLV